MSNRTLWGVVIVIGVIVILLAIFAHQLGLGSSGFGIKKIVLLIVGMVIGGVGVYGLMRNS